MSATDFVHEPTSSYESRSVHGFTVMVSEAARAHPDSTDPALELLEEELKEVSELVPESALALLRTIRIWVEHENPDRPCACYHVSATWLRANGYNVEKARSVEISNCANFVEWVTRTQPMMVLHELAHGYHDIVFGYDDAAIRAAFERARDDGIYDAIDYVHGGVTRHYALTNQMEYFAELSESYFGKNDFFPFTRDELRQHDPLGLAAIEAAWSLDPAAYVIEQPKTLWFDVDAFDASTAVDLLIIAPRAFMEPLKPYVRFKQAALRTELVSLQDVLLQSEGADDAERLKRYVFDRWKNNKARYALLVGDADIMPVRSMVLDRNTDPAFNYAFYPSDLYYSDLAKTDGSFESWNARCDDFHAQYFGEVRGEHHKSDPINFDQIDYLPDIAVGRWPASTVGEVETLVAKSIAYEKSLHVDAETRRAVAALIACGGWIENRGLMDRIASACETNFGIEKRYFADAKRNDSTPPPDAAQVVELMNAGARIILHSGHGTDDSWHDSLHRSHISQLANAAHLPIVFSAGCSTARFASLGPYEPYLDMHGAEHAGTNNGEVFDSPPPPPAVYQTGAFNHTGLGEQLLRAGPNGAVAYIGCNTGSQPCGMTLMEGFARAIGNADQDVRLGDAWTAAIAHYYNAENLATIEPTESWYPASIFFQGMKFMLFGDPSLPLPGVQSEPRP